MWPQRRQVQRANLAGGARSCSVYRCTVVEAAKEQPSWGVQKPPCRYGKKRFPGVCSAAPEVAGKVQKPTCLLPADQSGGWFDRHASPRQSAAVSWTARFGVWVHTGFELDDGDDFIPGPNSDGEGAGPAAQGDVGAIVGALQEVFQETVLLDEK